MTQNYDWIAEFGTEKLQGKDGEVDTNTLSSLDVVMIYFSAHWCPPCKGFTPVLVEKYQKLKEAGKKFECVFVSSDQSQKDFDGYFAEMPWLAMQYSDVANKEKLRGKHGCHNFPYLVLCDAKTGDTITTNGRGGISGKNPIENFPFHPKAVYDVSENMDDITDGLAFLLVQDGCDPEVQKANGDILNQVIAQKKDHNIKTFYTVNGGGRLRLLGLNAI